MGHMMQESTAQDAGTAPAFSRRPIAGILLFLMVLATIADGLLDLSGSRVLIWCAGLCGWAAAALLFQDTPASLRVQAGIIILIGIVLAAFSYTRGVRSDYFWVVSGNTGLLSMIAAVGFLRLIVLSHKSRHSALPVGRKAFVRTLAGLSLFSSVTNVSAPILICDRIHAERPLTFLTCLCATRVFCGSASWSPFYGAMAIVLTYVPQASLFWLICAGLPFSMAGLSLVIIYGLKAKHREVQDFVGYPVRPRDLKVPFLLMLTVLAAFMLLEGVPTLVIIALCALLVTATLLLCRQGIRGCLHEISGQIREGLPKICNELVLFVSAGVLAVGVSSLIKSGVLYSPFSEFGYATSVQLLAFMVVLAAAGIHPVIQIIGFSPVLLDLDPNSNLLACTYLFAWHLGTCSSPLSGTNLMFQGRYGIPSWRTAVWNWPYSATMMAVAAVWLYLVTRGLPGFS